MVNSDFIKISRSPALESKKIVIQKGAERNL
jgi:hypothetical protein